MRKQAEERKMQLLRNLQNKYGKAKPSEVLEAEKVIAEFRQQKASDSEAIARAILPLPSDHACPDCFVKSGITSHMIPIPSDTKNDLFKCKACGIIITVKP